jgi:GAF domain-containing protein
MTDKKRGGRRSDRPLPEVDLKAQRAEFVHTFFKKGAELTEQLLKENERLRRELSGVEAENTKLKTQLASDTAMRDLLKKIKELEAEKDDLLSSFHAQEAATNRFSNRFAEIESELENFANLYVASYQLHSTLRLPAVLKHLKELLVQLVGARSLAIYVVDVERTRLTPVVTEGAGEPRAILLDGGAAAADATTSAVERAYLTGVAGIVEGDVAAHGADLPVACVPIRFDGEVIGVIAVFALLAQKRAFVTVDFELFKLLGAHAGTALVGARLFEAALERGEKPVA